MLDAVILTGFQLAWAVWWARLHARIRAGRTYAAGRIPAGTDAWYRRLSPAMYVLQNALSVACFWSDAPALLPLHRSLALRLAGVGLYLVASCLYAWALRHLGGTYAPCYDAHLPTRVVTTGPYRWIRHPMYLAKLLLGAATVLTNGSGWFLIVTVYFYAATLRALGAEERLLPVALPGYAEYHARTGRLLPRFR